MNKNLKYGLGLILLVVIVLLVSNLKDKNSLDPNAAPFKIGIATLLSGDFAVLGTNIMNSAMLAADEINAKGGIDGRRVEFFVENSGVDSKTGLSAVQKLVNVDHVSYIIAGMTSNGTIAAAPILNASKVVALTPVTGGRNVDEAGEYVFRTANADVLAGRDLANAMIKLGYTNVAVIAEVTEYTVDIKKTFEATIAAKGGTVVYSDAFQPNTKDYRTMIEKVKVQKPQAILILSQLGTNAAYFIRQSRELGLNTPLFTDFTLAANSDAKNIAGSFDGIYFADPAYDADSKKTQDFLNAYKTKYRMDPAIPFHSAATYDAMMLIAKAIDKEGDNPEAVKNWLLNNVKDYEGLMGTYSLDENGNSDLGFVVKVIRNGKPESLK